LKKRLKNILIFTEKYQKLKKRKKKNEKKTLIFGAIRNSFGSSFLILDSNFQLQRRYIFSRSSAKYFYLQYLFSVNTPYTIKQEYSFGIRKS